MFTDIRLQNFRSYQDASFDLGAGVNIVVGPNASGKTNLLEAILVVADGSSYRAKDGALVRFEADWARLDVHTPNGQRTVKLTRTSDRVTKKFELDDVAFSRLSLNKTIPVVVFEPNDLQLLNGQPAARRDYIDDLAERLVVGYKDLRQRYRRALQQRNSLLKKAPAQISNQLFAWNIRLSELGGNVYDARRQVLDRLSERISETYSEIAKKPFDITLSYQSACTSSNYGSSLLKRLEKQSELDMLRGFTGSGPHRDDVLVEIGGQPAQEAASRGEVRTLVLALKIIELQLLEAAREQKPLLLLDDVFSELDGKRRRALTRHLRNYQTFITTTDADVVIKHFAEDCNVIAIQPPGYH